jgi:sulfide dehydrogenase cytochrome subunit
MSAEFFNVDLKGIKGMMNTFGKYLLLFCAAVFGLGIVQYVGAGELGKLIEPCGQCHGKNSEKPEEIPSIGGLPASYLRTTLTQYKNKERPCMIMCGIVKDFSVEDINQVADHFAAEKFVAFEQKFDSILAQKGKVLHEENCIMCHAADATQAHSSSILLGQKMPYLEEQFKFISEGTRHMPEAMMVNFRKLSKNNYAELIHYYSSAK